MNNVMKLIGIARNEEVPLASPYNPTALLDSHYRLYATDVFTRRGKTTVIKVEALDNPVEASNPSFNIAPQLGEIRDRQTGNMVALRRPLDPKDPSSAEAYTAVHPL